MSWHAVKINQSVCLRKYSFLFATFWTLFVLMFTVPTRFADSVVCTLNRLTTLLLHCGSLSILTSFQKGLCALFSSHIWSAMYDSVISLQLIVYQCSSCLSFIKEAPDSSVVVFYVTSIKRVYIMVRFSHIFLQSDCGFFFYLLESICVKWSIKYLRLAAADVFDERSCRTQSLRILLVSCQG